MPIQIKCGQCGTVLAEFNDLPIQSLITRGKRGVVKQKERMTPAEFVIQQNDGECPKCGKKLETDRNKQQISIFPFIGVE